MRGLNYGPGFSARAKDARVKDAGAFCLEVILGPHQDGGKASSGPQFRKIRMRNGQEEITINIFTNL